MTGPIVRFMESPWEGNLSDESDGPMHGAPDHGMLQEVDSAVGWRPQVATSLESIADASAQDVWQALQDVELEGGLVEVVDADELGATARVSPFALLGPGWKGGGRVNKDRGHVRPAHGVLQPVDETPSAGSEADAGGLIPVDGQEPSFVDLWKRSAQGKGAAWIHAHSAVSRPPARPGREWNGGVKERPVTTHTAVVMVSEAQGEDQPDDSWVASEPAGSLADLVRSTHSTVEVRKGLQRRVVDEQSPSRQPSALKLPGLDARVEQVVKQVLEQQAAGSVSAKPVGERSHPTTDVLIAAALISGVEEPSTRAVNRSESEKPVRLEGEKPVRSEGAQPVWLESEKPLEKSQVGKEPPRDGSSAVQIDLSGLLAQSLPLAIQKVLPSALGEALPGALRRLLPQGVPGATRRPAAVFGARSGEEERSISLKEQRQMQRPWIEVWLERASGSSAGASKTKSDLKGVRFYQLRASVKSVEPALARKSQQLQENGHASATSADSRSEAVVKPVVITLPVEKREPVVVQAPVVVPVPPVEVETLVTVKLPVEVEIPVIVEPPAPVVESSPVAGEQPVPVESSPVVDEQSLPVESSPVVDEQPVPVESSPVVDEQPVPVESSSVAGEQPVPVELSPVVDEQPVPVESSPVVEEQPVPVESSPVAGETPVLVVAAEDRGVEIAVADNREPGGRVLVQKELALVPVESLGRGVVHLLGDMAEGIVTMAGRLDPAALPARVDAPRFYDRMGGKVYHGVQAVVTGVGSILVGGVGMAFGTVGCVLGAAGKVGKQGVGGRFVTKTRN